MCNFCFSNYSSNKANIFLGLIEYELNSLLGASHLVDYISVHIRFDLERYLLNIRLEKFFSSFLTWNKFLLISETMDPSHDTANKGSKRG